MIGIDRGYAPWFYNGFGILKKFQGPGNPGFPLVLEIEDFQIPRKAMLFFGFEI
jgi:hypothetical protein